MKKHISFGIAILLLSCNGNEEETTSSLIENQRPDIPVPTVVYENMGDEKAYEERRDAYFDLIHSNSDNSDWKAINEANFREKGAERAELAQYRLLETFAEGNMSGEWRERGSSDVPGNVRICDYHPSTEDIYAISDGGILWKGNRDGETWTPLNDNLQLGRNIIKVIDLPDGGVRIFAAIGYGLRYSDDYGENWTNIEGILGSSGSGIKLVELNDENQTLVYLYNQVSIVDGSSQNRLAYSTDNGVNFEVVTVFSTGSTRFTSLHQAHNSSAAYILDRNEDVYKFEAETLTLIAEDLDLDGSNRCQIRANEAEGDLTLYALMDNESLYKSTDAGLSFDFVGNPPTTPWDVGFQVSIDDPDILYYGEVNLYRSFNGGTSWNLVSEWWEYYDDVEGKIHADIMSIEPYKTLEGTEFTVIPNHGGIYASYDNLLSTENIALQDLNTGQFYDVLTHPTNDALIFGGTQDQGFQRTLIGDSPEPSSFEQVISGDYGEMQFTDNAQTIWIQYPGADFQIYPNAETDDWYSYDFNLDGSDMPNVNWIVPTGAAPNPSDDFIYVGGGSLDGGSGSYLVKLRFTGGGISSSQYDYNFKSASGASISAIETSPLNEAFIYVVTESGRFFYSYDTGDSFEMTEDYIGPSGGWIYTADIYASRITPGLVFVGGSGYAGESVYMSTDSAQTFIGLEGDMPNTMVHEMAMDPEERFLFAATDAGPYVYSMELEEWFDMAGLSAPLQQYISVEFIPTEYVVRFATWGRGIWDFDMINTSGIIETEPESKLTIYPNPAVNQPVTVSVSENAQLQLFDLNGKLVLSMQLIQGSNLVDLSDLTQGTYLLVSQTDSGIVHAKKIIVAN